MGIRFFVVQKLSSPYSSCIGSLSFWFARNIDGSPKPTQYNGPILNLALTNLPCVLCVVIHKACIVCYVVPLVA